MPYKNKEYQKEYRKKNIEKLKKYSKEWRRNNIEKIREYDKKYSLKNREKITKVKKEYRQNNKEKFKKYRQHNCNIGYFKKYYQENKERLKEYNKENAKKYCQENKERLKENAKKYRQENKEKRNRYIRERMRTNVKFKLHVRMATSIYHSLRSKKSGRKWESLVGYAIEDLIKHLESKFEDWMSWDNYGRYERGGGKRWHIDHIKPQSLFNYESPEDEEFKKCWALKNLQPLDAVENIIKSNSSAIL